MIICPGAGFGHGGIAKSYPGVSAVDRIYVQVNGGRVSWRMDTLGSIILHEYTHFFALVVPPLAKETDDPWYGAWQVRGNAPTFDYAFATNNADR